MTLTVFRLDVLLAILVSLALFMGGHPTLFFVWGFLLQRFTVRRWDAYLQSQRSSREVSPRQKALLLFGLLVPTAVAHLFCVLSQVLLENGERGPAVLCALLASGTVFGCAFIVSRFVNRTWSAARA